MPFIVTLPPLSGFNKQTVWIDNFASAGVFVLLALGLNVVVGMAGLLDLGYAAFFAIGAYTYAYGLVRRSPTSASRSGSCCPIGAVVAAIFGILLGAPTLRLRGDYLAIVTLGFGEIVPDRVPERQRLDQRHHGHRRPSTGHRRHRLWLVDRVTSAAPRPVLPHHGGPHHRRP